MTDKKLDILVRRKAKLAAEGTDLAIVIGDAFKERYGVEPADVDCDAVIDALDYGVVRGCTLDYVDKHMAACGSPA